MIRQLGGRCATVWLCATTGCGLLTWLAAPALLEATQQVRAGTAGAAGFGPWVVWASALAALCCAVWLWPVTTLVLLGAATGRPPRTVRGCPAGLRRVLLAGCGLAVASGLAGPAGATDGGDVRSTPVVGPGVVRGLPLPERPLSTAHPPPASGRSWVLVAPGDTLWGLAVETLPAGAGDRWITRRWQHIHALNRAVVGPDPDLIHPGTRLRLPGAPAGPEDRRPR